MPKTQEKPRPASWRVYGVHRKLVKDMAKSEKVSEAEIVRRAIEERAARV